MIDLMWIGLAFILGLLSYMIRIPPLIGYLFAGFALKFIGVSEIPGLDEFSEFGITLLLFSIGLKLNLKSLVRIEVLGVTFIQAMVTMGVFVCLFYVLPLDLNLNSTLLIAFALTFSSTVYVFKILEERGDFAAQYGLMSISILIIQDILAVLFIAFSNNQIPSVWLFALIILLAPLRFILLRLLNSIRSGELLILFGMSTALAGAYVFDLVNIKGDLGALIMGVILSRHSRSNELSKSLLDFKNFFLLGFFLSIGFYGIPSWSQLGIALSICLVLPFRSFLYFFLFTKFGFTGRSAFLGSLGLFNYSEFGLIVISIGASLKIIDPSWLTIMALSLSLSFIISSLVNMRALDLYRHFSSKLQKFQKTNLIDYEQELSFGDANVLIVGMGRIGTGVFQHLEKDSRWRPLGVDLLEDAITRCNEKGVKVTHVNATNPDTWHRVNFKKNAIELIMLAMPLFSQNKYAIQLLRENGYQGKISSIAKDNTEIELLKKAGADQAFNLYAEAGVGFAESTSQ